MANTANTLAYPQQDSGLGYPVLQQDSLPFSPALKNPLGNSAGGQSGLHQPPQPSPSLSIAPEAVGSGGLRLPTTSDLGGSPPSANNIYSSHVGNSGVAGGSGGADYVTTRPLTQTYQADLNPVPYGSIRIPYSGGAGGISVGSAENAQKRDKYAAKRKKYALDRNRQTNRQNLYDPRIRGSTASLGQGTTSDSRPKLNGLGNNKVEDTAGYEPQQRRRRKKWGSRHKFSTAATGYGGGGPGAGRISSGVGKRRFDRVVIDSEDSLYVPDYQYEYEYV